MKFNKDDFIIALDIGTSSVRAMVFDQYGVVHASERKSYPVVRPKPGFEEQAPHQITEQCRETVYKCLEQLSDEDKNRVGTLCCSSQMYSLIAVDEAKHPLINSIIWSDGRSSKQALAHRSPDHPQGLWYRINGCPASSMYPVHKLEWLKQVQPETFTKASRFISIKEFVLEPLIGCYAVDYSIASATGMLDIYKREWASEILTEIGIDESRLPELVDGSKEFVCVDADVARSWGLNPWTRIFIGAGDGPLANLGSGAYETGMVNIDLGTSGAARILLDRPLLDEKLGLFCYCLEDDSWVTGGIITNAGNALQWCASKIVGYDVQYDTEHCWKLLDRYASAAPPGSGGIVFLPYLRPVRSPFWDDNLATTIYGLKPDHDLSHICRAMFEAIACDVALILEGLTSICTIKGPIILTGGLSKSVILVNILADMLDTQIVVPENSEGSIAGAAAFGLHAMGILGKPAFTPSEQTVFKGSVHTSSPANTKLYAQVRNRHKQIVQWAATAPSLNVGSFYCGEEIL